MTPVVVEAVIRGDGVSTCFAELELDPLQAFGRVRAPVEATVGATTYRTTVFRMNGCVGVPLRRSVREAAGVVPGDRMRVRLELDDEERTVDLARALRAGEVLRAFESMSFTHRREWAEAVFRAKKPDTRERRIAACVEAVRARAAGPAKDVRGTGGRRGRGGKQGARG